MKNVILLSLLFLFNSCGIFINVNKEVNEINSYVETIRDDKTLPNHLAVGECDHCGRFGYKLYFERICFYDETSKNLLRFKNLGKEKEYQDDDYYYKNNNLVFIQFKHKNKNGKAEVVKVYLRDNAIIFKNLKYKIGLLKIK